MSREELNNLVAFCILMENREGIVGKSPDYILEKYDRYVLGHGDAPNGLDANNRAKYSQYQATWFKEGENGN